MAEGTSSIGDTVSEVATTFTIGTANVIDEWSLRRMLTPVGWKMLEPCVLAEKGPLHLQTLLKL